MRELKLESNKLKLTMESGVEMLSFPTVKQRKMLAIEIKKADEDEELLTDALQDYLLELGMKRESFDGLEVAHLNQIIGEFNAVPK